MLGFAVADPEDGFAGSTPSPAPRLAAMFLGLKGKRPVTTSNVVRSATGRLSFVNSQNQPGKRPQMSPYREATRRKALRAAWRSLFSIRITRGAALAVSVVSAITAVGATPAARSRAF